MAFSLGHDFRWTADFSRPLIDANRVNSGSIRFACWILMVSKENAAIGNLGQSFVDSLIGKCNLACLARDVDDAQCASWISK